MDDHDRGLKFDLEAMSRRKLLGMLAGVAVVGFSTRLQSGPGPRPGAILEEIAGPFPADGSSQFNLLKESGLLRSDLRPSFARLKGRAQGQPLSLELQLVDRATAKPLVGYALYLWHCNREGRYSIYEVEDQNYLRGLQVSDAEGMLRFQTIFPGCYEGRWPHLHFEIFKDLSTANGSENALSTSQLALPPEICAQVYRLPGYAISLAHFAPQSLPQDPVFGDGYERQLGRMLSQTKLALKIPV